MTKRKTLKACPFCGYTEEQPIYGYCPMNGYFIHCQCCDTSGPMGCTKADARRLWNGREEED